MPKIDPHRLRKLRGGTSRKKLADRARISERQLRRLESNPGGSRSVREHTLTRLAKALGVDIGVLTGELALPESGKAATPDAGRVQIGAQIPPRARLAYDLVERRYGVSMTEIIGVAPLFFVLLAEGSLARRREKCEESCGVLKQLQEAWMEIGHDVTEGGTFLSEEAYRHEEASIEKADIFGRHVVENADDFFGVTLGDPNPFEGDKQLSDLISDILARRVTLEATNPFAAYLRELSKNLDKPGAVVVVNGDLRYGVPPKFPAYDIWRDEIDRMANGSPDARRTLELGYARLSDIPDELMDEDPGEKRAAWLEEKLPDDYRGLKEGSPKAVAAQIAAASAPGDVKKAMNEGLSRITTRKGDDR